jgi:hypothetical protein
MENEGMNEHFHRRARSESGGKEAKEWKNWFKPVHFCLIWKELAKEQKHNL